MLRLDKIHPLISGNKWFKLRYYLEEAKQQNKKRVVTFGGAWSNHIIATAAASRLDEIDCTGIIRGEEPARPSAVLLKAASLGMKLIFTGRKDFAAGRIPEELRSESNYIIPQGGYGEPGVKGAADIMSFADQADHYTHICCAAGTGTLMAGLIQSASSSQQVIGISVLKNNFQLENDIKKFLPENACNYRIIPDYHFGGYAKKNASLLHFMNEWYRQTKIPTDFVYTGKLCFAVADLADNYFFPEGSRVLLIHSGGLTGNTSIKNGTLIF